jgi:hypothetical protein
MDSQESLITDIHERIISSDKDYTLDSLCGAINRIEKAFSRYNSFLMEFIQNADDAESHFLSIELDNGIVTVKNDGKPFNNEDVKSICKIGRSSKNARDYIGYLGVGFKSVFLICDSIEIKSGPFSFKFSKNDWADPDHTPWQIIPIWISRKIPDINFTNFKFKFKDKKLIEEFNSELLPENLNSRILLFLRNVNQISFLNKSERYSRIIEKKLISTYSHYEIIALSEKINNETVFENFYLTFKKLCYVPEEVKKDRVTIEWERENVDKREISVAFKLDSGDTCSLIDEEKGTAHIGVFSFLPLKEVVSGLKFLIQADFLTTAGRSDLVRDCLWNTWLVDEIHDMIIENCIPIFIEHPVWRNSFQNVLYSKQPGNTLFGKNLQNRLNEYILTKPVFITDDGTIATSQELIIVDRKTRRFFSSEEFETVYQGKKIADENCIIPYEIQKKIEKIPESLVEFLDSEIGKFVSENRSKKRDIAFFKEIYSSLLKDYSLNFFEANYTQYNVKHDEFWTRLYKSTIPMILTSQGKNVGINECFTNPQKIDIPTEIEDQINIVHPDIESSPEFKQFLDHLNNVRYNRLAPEEKRIPEISSEILKSIFHEKDVMKMTSDEWKQLDEEEKIRSIRKIFEIWTKYQVPIKEKYPYITIKAKTGRWISPINLIFPKEYNPDHNLELLKHNGLLDIDYSFVNPIYIESATIDQIKQWKKFFKELGVESKMASQSVSSMGNEKTERSKIVERIGVLSVLKTETEEGGNPRELGESEKKGYDIESEFEGKLKFIEVKSTAEQRRDIFLTNNEFKTLQKYGNDYYIYIVTNALKNPTVHVIQGSLLLEKADINVIIKFKQWIDFSSEAIPLL